MSSNALQITRTTQHPGKIVVARQASPHHVTLESVLILDDSLENIVAAKMFVELYGFKDELKTLKEEFGILADRYSHLEKQRDDLLGENEKLRQPVEPDWWYCDIDPDESGDSAYEALHQHRPRLEPVQLHSSYIGPRKWGVLAQKDSDDFECQGEEEAFLFDTEADAQAFCDKRKAANASVWEQ